MLYLNVTLREVLFSVSPEGIKLSVNATYKHFNLRNSTHHQAETTSGRRVRVGKMLNVRYKTKFL